MMKCINKGRRQLPNGSLVDELECTSIFALNDKSKVVFDGAYPNKQLRESIELINDFTSIKVNSSHGLLLKSLYFISSENIYKNSLFSFHIIKNSVDTHQLDFLLTDDQNFYKQFNDEFSSGLVIPPLCDFSIEFQLDNKPIEEWTLFKGMICFDLRKRVS